MPGIRRSALKAIFPAQELAFLHPLCETGISCALWPNPWLLNGNSCFVLLEQWVLVGWVWMERQDLHPDGWFPPECWLSFLRPESKSCPGQRASATGSDTVSLASYWGKLPPRARCRMSSVSAYKQAAPFLCLSREPFIAGLSRANVWQFKRLWALNKHQ